MAPESKINKENAAHFGQFISVKVEKILRKSQVQFREKLRISRLRQNGGFRIEKRFSLLMYRVASCKIEA